MLILGRKLGEAIVVGGNVTVRVLEVHGERIKLGIEGPKNVKVDREEVHNGTAKRPLKCSHAT